MKRSICIISILTIHSFVCWSLSFYPQPYYNYKRKSTQGLAIDFPTLNLLGFTCYTISQSAFLWSPTIKQQYAERHPDAPETTVRFNDFAFGAHAFVMCALIYTQFFPSIWGFKVGRRQRASRVVLGILVGSFIAIFISIILVLSRTSSSSNLTSWEWIDVVSLDLNQIIAYERIIANLSHLGLHLWLREIGVLGCQIHPSGLPKLQT